MWTLQINTYVVLNWKLPGVKLFRDCMKWIIVNQKVGVHGQADIVPLSFFFCFMWAQYRRHGNWVDSLCSLWGVLFVQQSGLSKQKFKRAIPSHDVTTCNSKQWRHHLQFQAMTSQSGIPSHTVTQSISWSHVGGRLWIGKSTGNCTGCTADRHSIAELEVDWTHVI